LTGLGLELRHALRSLRRAPGFAAAAVLTLALGIGANTAIYSLTDQVLLRLLPVRDPGGLVILRMPGPTSGRLWSDIDDGAQSFSYAFYKGLRDRSPFVSGVLARFAIPLSVSGPDGTERASGELVSGNYFDVLGVAPVLGRLLTPDDDRIPGAHPVAVLSHGYWTRRFGASPSVLGRDLVVNGRALTVIGVARAPFTGVQLGQPTDLFVPITMKAQMTPNWDGLDDPNDYWLQMMARLAPGVSREQAEAGLQPIARALLQQQVDNLRGKSADKRARLLDRALRLAPGSQGRLVLQEEVRGGILLLSALVGLVLLIACANVANLLLARGVARRREIAIRLALGARRVHLVRQLLGESLLLALAGGLVGLLVAVWSTDSILVLIPREDGIGALSSHLDLRMLAFNFAVALLTGLAFGLLPALQATRPDLVRAIKEQGAGGGTGPGHVRLRKGLVVAQIAVTAVLLVTAGLFTRTLQRLKGVDLGLRIENLATFSIAPQLNGYSPGQTATLLDRLLAGIAVLPGVTAASAAEIAVLTDNADSSNATIEGFTPGADDQAQLLKNWVGPGYFATLGIPLLAGREIAATDAAAGPKVALINRTMARRYFADRNPIGLRFAFGAGDRVRPDIEIIGVVGDSKHTTVRQGEHAFVYMPYAQNPRLGDATFYVRSTLPVAALGPAVRETVHRIDSHLPVFGVKTLERQLDESLSGERMLTALSIGFGFLASLLASIGLYGTMAYAVARRTPEIGVRMALGASARHVRGLVLREAMVMAAAGLLIGLPAALAAGRLARSLLFGVEPGDPWLLAAAGLLLTGVMLLAASVPARRATRIDPMTALRSE
jgi:predicted permease